jgi:hypothetical protein
VEEVGSSTEASPDSCSAVMSGLVEVDLPSWNLEVRSLSETSQRKALGVPCKRKSFKTTKDSEMRNSQTSET